MKAAVFRNQTVSIEDRPRPTLKTDEVLLKVLASGICQTDIELFKGYYGFEGVAGHEFVGRVEESPGDPNLLGRRVVTAINVGCGECTWCRSGDSRHCTVRRVIGIKEYDGAFAEYVKAPFKNVYPVDEAIKEDEAVFTEPLAAALAVAERIHITPEQRMGVLGDGKLGLLIAIALSRYSPGLILMGRHEAKLELARQQGVETIKMEKGPGVGSKPDPFDVIVEVTGKPDGIDDALDLVKPRGTVVVKTTSHELSQINLARVVVDEITLTGSRCGDFRLALAFLKNKWIDVRPLIEATYPFKNFEEAFAHARRPGTGKILLRY